MTRSKILFGDCRQIMKRWGAQGVKAQTCVTSPPYFGLRDYGAAGQLGLEKTPEAYVAAMVEVFRCVRDVLADDGTLWLNIGDSYNAAGRVGHGTREGYKQGTNRASATRVDNCRPSVAALQPKELIGIPWMLAFALRADGWLLRQDIIWAKPNPMPESVTDRCTKAHEYIFLLVKQPKYYYDHEAIKTPVGQDWGTRDRTDGKYHKPGTGLAPHGGLEKSYTMANKRSVWTVAPKPFAGAHFAVFPPALIEPCVLAGSRPGDFVLDPFMGSGTTALVARQNGRRYLGCELNKEYEPLQKQHIAENYRRQAAD